MGDKSKIEWTDASWNPVTGCDKVSAGCKHCYAEVMSSRLKAMGSPNYRNGFKVTLQPHKLEDPVKWKRPRKIFVNSMSDLFHRDVPDDYIRQVVDVMRRCPQHVFQVLTKRPERADEFFQMLDDEGRKAPDNLWLGTSIEDERVLGRLDDLFCTFYTVSRRFLSLEPLLGPLPDLNLHGINWVIVGGESGQNARPMDVDWARQIRDQCVDYGTPLLFKQHGGANKKAAGRELDGRTWDEFPHPIVTTPGPDHPDVVSGKILAWFSDTYVAELRAAQAKICARIEARRAQRKQAASHRSSL